MFVCFSDLIGKGELTGEDLNSFIFVDRPGKSYLTSRWTLYFEGLGSFLVAGEDPLSTKT